MGFADRSDRERALVQIGRVIDRLVREGTAVARSDGSVHTLFPVAVSAAEAEALQGWIIREGAVHTIEVGLGYAISALFVCAGLCTDDLHHWAVVRTASAPDTRPFDYYVAF